MKRRISCILVLALVLCCAACGNQTPGETTPALPEGDYLMIPIDPSALHAIESGNAFIPEGTYITAVSPSGEKYYISLVAKGEDHSNGGILMNTSNGDKVYMFHEDGHYSFVKTMTKARSCYSEDDQLLWEMTITASFRYDGQTVSCTEVTGNVYVAATGSWYVISETPEFDGNIATYTVEFGRTTLGITTSTAAYTLTLTCDEHGNLQ